MLRGGGSEEEVFLEVCAPTALAREEEKEETPVDETGVTKDEAKPVPI